MAMHSIQVDEEVLTYLKERAEPFVDTPNSVLRRELLGRESLAERDGPFPMGAREPDDTEGLVPEVPSGVPQALAQLLQVAHLVTQKGMTRQEATPVVARFHDVAPQTVNDKYGRQAGLTASAFDQLLAQPGLTNLRSLLRKRFPRHDGVVAELLGDQQGPANRTDTSVPVPREPLTYTQAGYLRGGTPTGATVVLWHEAEGRTGYHLYWNGQWHQRFGQAEMERDLGISVRAKRSGSQEGYPAEAVIHAAWRHLVDQYNAGEPNVEYTRARPGEVPPPLS